MGRSSKVMGHELEGLGISGPGFGLPGVRLAGRSQGDVGWGLKAAPPVAQPLGDQGDSVILPVIADRDGVGLPRSGLGECEQGNTLADHPLEPRFGEGALHQRVRPIIPLIGF